MVRKMVSPDRFYKQDTKVQNGIWLIEWIQTYFGVSRSMMTIHVPMKYPGHSNSKIMIDCMCFEDVIFERALPSRTLI